MFGVDPRTGDDLYAAARANDAVALKLCLDKKVCDVNYRVGKDRWTALLRASHDGHVPIVQMLLEADADPGVESALGRTALHAAAHANHAPVVRLLLDAKADMNSRDVYSRTAMDLARSYGDTTDVIALLEAEARDGGRNDRIRRAKAKVGIAVELAAEAKSQVTGRRGALRRLVAARGALEGKEEEELEGEIADVFEGAAAGSEEEEGESLSAWNSVKSRLGVTPQRMANSKSAGAAGMFAAAFGKIRALRALIDAGSDVNKTDPKFNGNTPLHWAVLHKKDEAISLLLASGADPTKSNRDGMSPLDLAREMGSELAEAIKAMERTPKGQADAAARAAEEKAFRDATREAEARAAARARAERSLRTL